MSGDRDTCSGIQNHQCKPWLDLLNRECFDRRKGLCFYAFSNISLLYFRLHIIYSCGFVFVFISTLKIPFSLTSWPMYQCTNVVSCAVQIFDTLLALG